MGRSLAEVKTLVNSIILTDEVAVGGYAEDDEELLTYGPNWGVDPGALGSGLHSGWLGSGWSDCVCGPSDF